MGAGETVRADLHRKPSSGIREAALYKIINRGVLENKGVQPAIPGSHRFGVTLIEVPVGQGANQHSGALQ